uniref:C2H2-type domain-containing protein n=1 Tax=Cacopsylla melanoneura TaxID=428564 RepID=A0A8D8WSX2_9HEMI
MCLSIKLSFLFSDQLCVHCRHFLSSDMKYILDHCKSCTFMPRPDSFRCKFVCFGCHIYHTYNSSAMIKHINIHLGEKPFQCNYCSYRAIQKITLTKHVTRIHGVQK